MLPQYLILHIPARAALLPLSLPKPIAPSHLGRSDSPGPDRRHGSGPGHSSKPDGTSTDLSDEADDVA